MDTPIVGINYYGNEYYGAESPLDPMEFYIFRQVATSDPLTVTYTVGGTATDGADYESLSLTVTIPAYSTEVALIVTPIDDSEIEDEETVILTVIDDVDYDLTSTPIRTSKARWAISSMKMCRLWRSAPSQTTRWAPNRR